MKNILGLIPARSGSKGIPGKNIKNLAGKPLIAWTIDGALQSEVCSRIVVSTDDKEIAKVALDWGAEVPFIRPLALAEDTSTSISVVLHAIQWLDENEQYVPDYILFLQPTSPLRSKSDICNCVDIIESKKINAVVSVCETSSHPFIVKRISDEGLLQDFFPVPAKISRRQDMPKAFALNGSVYLNKCTQLKKTQTFLPEKTFAYVMPKERSIDIDTPLDFDIAEFLLTRHMGSHIVSLH